MFTRMTVEVVRGKYFFAKDDRGLRVFGHLNDCRKVVLKQSKVSVFFERLVPATLWPQVAVDDEVVGFVHQDDLGRPKATSWNLASEWDKVMRTVVLELGQASVPLADVIGQRSLNPRGKKARKQALKIA
ncbi:MAG: hypothetical protein HYT48_03355 [Candidatus Vogelbacteria bacterium]|nr:hypothetical protein [Candidatus Vogelbacteria bacterium]